MRNRKIFLISRFNTENLGDLAIAHQFLDDYRKSLNIIPISVFGDLFSFCNENDVWNIKNAKCLHTTKVKRTIQQLKLRQLIAKEDIILFAGGNMMCDVSELSDSSRKYLPYIKIARQKKCPMVAISVGFGPFVTKGQGVKARKVLDQCQFVSFRDTNSLDRYKMLGGNCKSISETVDVGYFYFKCHSRNKLNRTVGINVINPGLLKYSSADCHNIHEGYVRLIQSLIDNGLKVKLFITDIADQLFFNQIKNEFCSNVNVECYEPRGLNDLYEFYKTIDLLIGSRMHSMILGYSTGLPIIGLSWQDKIDDMFSTLGYEDRCIPLLTIKSRFNEIVSICMNIYNCYEEELNGIFVNYKALETKKKINDEILRSLL